MSIAYAIDTVTELKAEYTNGMVNLSWVNPTSDDLAGYIIVRCEQGVSSDPNDGVVVYENNNLDVNYYADVNIRKKRTYTYTIYTYDNTATFKEGVSVDVYTLESSLIFPKEITTCGNIGPTKPTQSDADNFYFETTLNGLITVENGKQFYIAPKNGYYTFEVSGAKGGAGNGNKSLPSCVGGFGAMLKGGMSVNAGDKFEMLIGQRGTDHNGTGGDGTTGAGGGGTFLVYHRYDSETQLYDEPVLLIAAAGGNGGRDTGYSGDGNTYHGMASTPIEQPSTGANNGGGYDTYVSNSNSGVSFIRGGDAATYVYSRSGSSSPGFGGGGSNQDDGDGGGGGGYFGGCVGASAYSYINTELLDNIDKKSGHNNGNGIVNISATLTTQGYLMINESDEFMYYDYDDENWIPFECDFSSNVIEEYSMSTLPFNLTKRVPNGTIIKCKDEHDTEIKYDVLKLPKTGIIRQVVNFDTTGKLIVGGKVNGSNDVSIIVSCDDGETWCYYTGDTWTNYNDDLIGMSIVEFNELTKNIWTSLGYKVTDKIRVGFIINPVEYDVVKVSTIMLNTIYI